VDLKAPKPEKARVSIGTRLLTIKRENWTKFAIFEMAEETEKKEKDGRRVSKPLYFTNTWRRQFATHPHQLW